MKGLASIYSIRHPMRCPVLMHRMIAVITVMGGVAAFFQGRTKSIDIILYGGGGGGIASASRVWGVRWVTGVSLLIVLSDDLAS